MKPPPAYRVILAFAGAARAQTNSSEASLVPVAISVALPVVIVAGIGAIVVTGVEASAQGTVWVVENVADGVKGRIQQSDQWALEKQAGSLDPAACTHERAQAWLQLRDDQPTVLHIDALTRLGRRITRANVAFDDHLNAKRFSDHIETVTVKSMLAWLQRTQLAGPATVVR